MQSEDSKMTFLTTVMCHLMSPLEGDVDSPFYLEIRRVEGDRLLVILVPEDEEMDIIEASVAREVWVRALAVVAADQLATIEKSSVESKVDNEGQLPPE